MLEHKIINNLIMRLSAEGIPTNRYSLNTQSSKDNKYCLEKDNGEWLVYYGERGGKYNIRNHVSLEDACDDIFLRLVKGKNTGFIN